MLSNQASITKTNNNKLNSSNKESLESIMIEIEGNHSRRVTAWNRTHHCSALWKQNNGTVLFDDKTPPKV